MCPSILGRIVTAGLRPARSPLLWVLGLGIAAGGAVLAESNRRTTDWQADLISMLVDRRMSEPALLICKRNFSESDPRSDSAARWAIRWSSVHASNLLASGEVGETEVDAAKQPIAELLQAYPQHDRHLWLRTQRAMVDFAAAQHAAVSYAVASHRPELQALGLKRISSSLRQLDEVEQTLRTELSRVASAPVADSQGEATVTSAELIVLQQNVGKQRVAAYLLRSHLFPDRSEDAVASASQAVGAADAALARMQSNAAARFEVIFLQAEALYRSGDSKRAAQRLDELQQALPGGLPPEALALKIRIAIEQAPGEAAELLTRYYGSEPAAAPLSTEMDLARLRWLLRAPDSRGSASREQTAAEVADWIEAIERRGGEYARRRGEAEALQRMRIAPDSSDVRLLAAEAGKRLREGEPMAAADLLVQAAQAAPQSELAIKYAQQAAAVFLAAEQPDRASEILIQTARTHRSEEPAAAKAHLQAALVISKTLAGSGNRDVEPLIALLKEHAALWPRQPTSEQAVSWLLRILRGAQRDAEAARFLMNQAEPDEEEVRAAGESWRVALRASDDPSTQQPLVDEALRLFADAAERSAQVQRVADWQAVWTAALFGTRSQLQSVRSRLPDASPQEATAEEPSRFIRSLVRFRLEAKPASTLVTERLAGHRVTVVDAIERLRTDGKDQAQDQQRLGSALVRLFEVLRKAEADHAGSPQPTVDPFAEPLAHVWTDNWQAAANQLESILRNVSPGDKADALEQAATILAASDSGDGQRKAIGYWKRLAQGLPQGSSRWHRAKLATAHLFVALGETQQAQQICQFVLITRPPEDPEVRAEYEAILQR